MIEYWTRLVRAIATVFAPVEPGVKVGFQAITDDVCHNVDGSFCRADKLPH
ncbi:MAG: hypothetical protein AAFX40_15100 [Cyanobacteria bacterium J06639_1]